MHGARATFVLVALLAGLVGVGEARQPKTLAEIAATGSVTACADPNNLPFSSADPREPGYDVEVIRALAAEVGARAEFKWIGTASGRAAIRYLLEGECDLFPGLPLSPGFADEYPRLEFSRAYYTMGHVIVAPAGEPVQGLLDLGSRVTAVEALSVADLFLLGKGHRRRSYRSQEAAFRAVRSREATAALLWAPLGGWLVKRSGAGDLALIAVADPDLSVPFAVGFLRKDPALKPALDAAIHRLQEKGVIKGSLSRYGIPVARAGPPGARQVMPAIWIDGARVRLVSVVRAQGAAPDVVEGRLIFQENCAECHRSDGRGGGSVPRLQAYPRGAEKRFIETVLHGRNSYGMPPWEGLLSEAQIRSVLEYVRALAPTVEVARGAPVEDQARQVFGQVCATCHGPAGAGTRLAPSLHAFKGTDDEFVSAVLDGRPGTAMAPFRSIVSAEMARTIREYVRGLSRLN